MKKREFFGKASLIFIGILVLTNLQTGCTKVDTTFYNKILSDFDTNSYFVALDLKSSTFRGRVIIENNNLYSFLHKTKGFNKDKYKSFMKALLIHHRPLKINNKNLTKWNFIKTYESESVLKIAILGEDEFISHYFNGIALNFGITKKEQTAIIDQLFYWEIPSKIDKITGELLIS